MLCLFCLIWFYTSQSTVFQLCGDGTSWVEPVLSKDKCVLLKDMMQWCQWGSNPGLPATPRSWVKHSTTELPQYVWDTPSEWKRLNIMRPVPGYYKHIPLQGPAVVSCILSPSFSTLWQTPGSSCCLGYGILFCSWFLRVC